MVKCSWSELSEQL